MKKIVVIGTGLAGYSFAKEFRKVDNASSLCMITNDDGAFYSKPLLSNAIAKNKQASQIATATHKQMAAQLSARIITRATVSLIDVEQKTVTCTAESFNAEIIPYDELVLCLGADQRQAGLGSAELASLHSVNNLADYEQFRDALTSVQNIAIVGTGLIGCEFANDLVSANKNVTVIGPGEYPLANIVPQQIGHFVATSLQKAGVNWRLGVKAVGLQMAGAAAQLKLSNGECIDTELVITAIGLVPRTKLAKDTNIKVNKGIVVDNQLQTSQPNIYALGDCAEINGSVMPFVLPIMHCARVVASNISTTPTALALPYMPIIVKTPACRIVALPVAKNISGQWQISYQGDDIKGLFFDDDEKLRGFVLTGSTVEERQALIKQLPVL